MTWQPQRGKVKALKDKLDLANQERTSLGRDFFPHVVERILFSDHLSSALADLQEKDMLVGRSQALREVASLGQVPLCGSPCPLVGHSVGKLMTLKPLIISFGNASAAGPSDGPMSGTDLGEEEPSSKTTCFLFLKDGEPTNFGNVTLLPFESTSKDETITLRREPTGRATTPRQRQPTEGGTTSAPMTLLATRAATTISSSSSGTLAAEPAGLPTDIGTLAGLEEKEAERFPGK
nr:hypothetical protein [Tanacetum cinerariifolium]